VIGLDDLTTTVPCSNGTMRLEKLLTASNSFVAALFAAHLPDRGLRARGWSLAADPLTPIGRLVYLLNTSNTLGQNRFT
jgi:hypothetical protein